jgi:hypothetical protein
VKALKFTLLAGLLLYSVALLWIDFAVSQDQVRGYLSDIVDGHDYPLPYFALFGINTTITVVLLTGISLLFAVCLGTRPPTSGDARLRFFLWSQFLFFLYLACDERLLIHEKAGKLLGVNDALLLGGLGLVELVLLFAAGDVMKQARSLKQRLAWACVFFAAMVLIDGLLPSLMPGRLAMEDLAKTWAIVFLFLYAWRFCMEWISARRQERGRRGG